MKPNISRPSSSPPFYTIPEEDEADDDAHSLMLLTLTAPPSSSPTPLPPESCLHTPSPLTVAPVLISPPTSPPSFPRQNSRYFPGQLHRPEPQRAYHDPNQYIEYRLSQMMRDPPHFSSYTLSDLEIFNTLGTGTFGRVYLCRLKSHHDIYFALKVMSKADVIHLKQVDHVHSEKEILSSVDSPFIVRLHNTFQDSKNIYMLMEYAVGGELFSCLRKLGKFSTEVSRFYAAEIVLALEYLHSRNIVYRDLKPENLLLDSTGHIKITDFGFAKQIASLTFTLCGTPEYLAPEIISGHGYGKEVDWWALGILIYEMLVGCPPFYDTSPFGIYKKILSGDLVFPKGPDAIDPLGQDLIRRLLHPDRSERLGAANNSVRFHPWFYGMDWQGLCYHSIPAPFISTHRHAGDTRNFEAYPEIPLDEVFSGTCSLTSNQQALFSHF